MKTIEYRIARTLVLVVSLMMSFPVFGQNDNAVDLNLARCVGENFFKMNPDIKLLGESVLLKRVETNKFPNLYIFNVEGGGSIIVAGDKRMQPILGFSEKGIFDPNNLPPAAEMIIGNYNSVVDSILRCNVRSTDESIKQAWIDLKNGYHQKEKGTRAEEPEYPLFYGPLITTTFGQGNIGKELWQNEYNQYCPVWEDIDNNNNIIGSYKAVTGCGATAMAQLLYYHKSEPKDIQNKKVNINNVLTDVPAFQGRFYQYHPNQNYLLLPLKLKKMGINIENHAYEDVNDTNVHWFKYFDWDYSNTNKDEVAKLMYYCGLKIESNYRIIVETSPNGSISFKGDTYSYLVDILSVLKTSFDDFPKAFIKQYDNSDWNDTLKKYISHDIPLIYRGENNSIGEAHSGEAHIYILDGYNTYVFGVFFHHNFGWGGKDDDYYFSNSGYWYPDGQMFLSTVPIKDPKDKCKPNVSCLPSSKNERDNTTNQMVYESITKYHEYMDAMTNYVSHVIGASYWQDEEKGMEFWNLFQSLLDNSTGMISEEGIQQLINQNQFEYVSDGFIRDIAERYNQSVLYWNEGYYTNDSLPEGYVGVIEYDTAAMRKAYEAQAYAESLGFSDVRQMYDNAYEMLEAEVGNQQTSVCASVTMQFAQKMTMTREAFNGTLQIFNGHESIPMEDIFVDFRIEDQQGNNCTDLFQINTLSLDQITGISGDGSLAAQTNGTALVQFIPTKNAAPTQPVVYSFGGSFNFIDPFTGEGLTYPLYPVDITVNPSPDLYVDYFMQRDILGDDALTLDVVEPSVPAELGVIINNKGAGMAKNVLLETAEPQIIDNEKGLAIDFAMYGASFNGSPRQLGLMEIPFGNIGSGQTAVGEWLFTSSLLGHFISYEAHVIHNSSYGNSDLSLVSHLDIHELIHPIYAYGNLDDGINDFLVNDNPDAYDTPDSIYFSHGGKTSVGVVDDISFDHYVSLSDTIVTLTVEPSRVGWNYGLTDDPGMNQYNIVSCIRNNDNQVIPLNNVWLTFVTIPDGGDPVYENKLHIVDTIPVQQTTTYTLVFAKKPSNLRIFHGNEDEYWSNAANWEGYILPQADDEVLIDGICQLDQDAEVFSLTVAENQSLTIPEDRILTVSGSLTNADASGLVIEEGGQLMHTNTGAQGTVQKNILPYTEDIKDGWYLVSSPLAGFTNVISVSDMLSNNYDLYYYDEPTHYWINQEYAANNFTELTNGKGYLYANSEEVMLGFEGELQSGSAVINVLLSYTDGIDLAGFNLVGNPYAHNVTSYSSVNVANGCYQINETKDDLVVSEIDEDNPLKPAEGFFVKATDVGASITFNLGRGETTNRSGSIRVELLDNGKLIDRLIVKREGEPLEKMSLNESRTKVFAMQDHREMAIVPCEGNEQPVNFKAAKNGTYTINVNTNGIEFNYLHLIDNFTGADVDLLALRQAQGSMSYTFEAKTSDYASRFRLVFSVCGDADGDSETFAFFSNGNWIIINNGEATLQVIDIHGHILSSETISGSCSKTIHAAPGVYMIRLINGENVKTQKIIIE